MILVCSMTAQADNEIDYGKIAIEMHSTYRNFGNGAAAMFALEYRCWDALKKKHDPMLARICTTYTITGELIDAGYMQKRGLNATPQYNPSIAAQRMIRQIEKAGFSTKDRQVIIDDSINNVDSISLALSNAGM